MSVLVTAPELRAERLLRDVLGDARFRELRSTGHLELPSQHFPGRVYRLDNFGNLAYREAGENSFNTTLCVQPEETVPRDDMVAARYLLVTADEERLLEVANPINFGLISLARTTYHDLARRKPAWIAAITTFVIFAFLLSAMPLLGWVLVAVRPHHAFIASALAIALLIPALIGMLLLAAAIVEAARAIRTWRARQLLAAK